MRCASPLHDDDVCLYVCWLDVVIGEKRRTEKQHGSVCVCVYMFVYDD